MAGRKEIMEQIVGVLMNEMDKAIQKIDITEELDHIKLIMLDGSNFIIKCEEPMKGEDDMLLSAQTIRDLYLGNLKPVYSEITIPNYQAKQKEFLQEYRKIYKFIPLELYDDFDKMCQMKAEITGEEVEDAFVKGFQIGMKLILESIATP